MAGGMRECVLPENVRLAPLENNTYEDLQLIFYFIYTLLLNYFAAPCTCIFLTATINFENKRFFKYATRVNHHNVQREKNRRVCVHAGSFRGAAAVRERRRDLHGDKKARRRKVEALLMPIIPLSDARAACGKRCGTPPPTAASARVRAHSLFIILNVP